MKKFKRLYALLGAILLVLLYLSTLIFALMDSELATGMFKVSVAGTIIIPILLYGILLFIVFPVKMILVKVNHSIIYIYSSAHTGTELFSSVLFFPYPFFSCRFCLFSKYSSIEIVFLFSYCSSLLSIKYLLYNLSLSEIPTFPLYEDLFQDIPASLYIYLNIPL